MPVATLVARLSDVAPDGISSLVATGVLNLTHRLSHVRPEALRPGVAVEVTIPLRASGYRWATGHRIRVTLLSNDWPVLWPSPLPGELTIHRGRLELPVLPDDAVTLEPPRFRIDPPDLRTVGGGVDDPPAWRIEEDAAAGTVTVGIFESGSTRLEDGRELYASERLTMTTSDDDPGHAQFATEVVYRWQEQAFATDIVATGSITSDAEDFELDVDIAVTVDGMPFFRRDWHERVPRRLV
jgi:hypothetical protein